MSVYFFRALIFNAMTVVLVGPIPSQASAIAEAAEHIDRIKSIGSEGAGNQEAGFAWKSLVNLGVDALIPTLAAMDDAKPIAVNWLRLAAQAIAEKEEQAKRKLPADKLETFVKDVMHAPVSRRSAYELLVLADPHAPDRLLPGMIEDPSVEIRRDSINAALEKATPLVKSDPAQAVKEFEKLFVASRDLDQTEKIVKTLKELKITPDVNGHFGVVADWMLIGPFDSAGGKGFAKAYEPETKVNLSAAYKGKQEKDVKWIAHASTEKHGAVDFNKVLSKHKEAVAYAFATIQSEKEQPVEIRFGCITSVKVFLNGKEIYERDEYHHGMRFDQYVAKGTLKTGRNEILVKVCQNNQTEPWAQDWTFQLRLCDFTGGALAVKVIKNK